LIRSVVDVAVSMPVARFPALCPSYDIMQKQHISASLSVITLLLGWFVVLQKWDYCRVSPEEPVAYENSALDDVFGNYHIRNSPTRLGSKDDQLAVSQPHWRRLKNKGDWVFNSRNDWVVFYHYGRVGSSAVERELGTFLIPRKKGNWYVSRNMTNFPRGSKVHDPEIATAVITSIPQGGRLWIFTFTRNPFEQYLSVMLQNVHRTPFFKNLTADLQINASYLMTQLPRDKWYGTWFFHEFEKVVGIDLTQQAAQLRTL